MRKMTDSNDMQLWYRAKATGRCAVENGPAEDSRPKHGVRQCDVEIQIFALSLTLRYVPLIDRLAVLNYVLLAGGVNAH